MTIISCSYPPFFTSFYTVVQRNKINKYKYINKINEYVFCLEKFTNINADNILSTLGGYFYMPNTPQRNNPILIG